MSIFAIPNALPFICHSFLRKGVTTCFCAWIFACGPLPAQINSRMLVIQDKLRYLESACTDSLYPAAVFAVVYQNTLRMQAEALAAGKIRDSLGMLRMTEVFFTYFDSAVRRRQAAMPNPPAWDAVFRDPQRRSLLHSMLLGIHAHVFHDLAPALMQSFDAAGLQAFRHDYFRMNRGFRCINRRKEKQLETAMQLKGWRKPVFRFGSRWIMRQFRQERRRAFKAALHGFENREKGKPLRLVQARRMDRNIRLLERMFRQPPLHRRLDQLDSLSRQQQLLLIWVSGCGL